MRLRYVRVAVAAESDSIARDTCHWRPGNSLVICSIMTHHVPLFSMEAHGSLTGSFSPSWSSSMDI